MFIKDSLRRRACAPLFFLLTAARVDVFNTRRGDAPRQVAEASGARPLLVPGSLLSVGSVRWRSQWPDVTATTDRLPRPRRKTDLTGHDGHGRGGSRPPGSPFDAGTRERLSLGDTNEQHGTDLGSPTTQLNPVLLAKARDFGPAPGRPSTFETGPAANPGLSSPSGTTPTIDLTRPQHDKRLRSGDGRGGFAQSQGRPPCGRAPTRRRSGF